MKKEKKKDGPIILDGPPLLESTPEERATAEKKKEVTFVIDSILNPKEQPSGELEEVEKAHVSKIGCQCNFCGDSRPPVISTRIIEPERPSFVSTRDLPKINLIRKREEDKK